MIDLLLINSPNNHFSAEHNSDPKMPIGLLAIANYLNKYNFVTKIIDCHTKSYTLIKLKESIDNFHPRLLGLNICTPNQEIVIKIVKYLKINSQYKVLLGGPHATCAPQEILKEIPNIDGIVIGEGEKIIFDLLFNNYNNFIKSPYCIDNRSPIFKASRMETIECIDPKTYYLLDLDKYFKVSKTIYLSTSRGCGHNCSFCSSKLFYSDGIRYKNKNELINEISKLKDEFGINSFYFYDENILIHPEIDSLLDEFSQLNINWKAEVNINDLKTDKIELLKSSGCNELSFGIESGSKEIQKYADKIIDDSIFLKLNISNSKNIMTRAYFIIGLLPENINTIVQTVIYILKLKKNGLSDIVVFPARPYPGTKYFSDYLNSTNGKNFKNPLSYTYLSDYKNEENTYVKRKLQKYNTVPSVNINSNFTTIEIRIIIRELYRIFINSESFENLSHSEINEYIKSKLNWNNNSTCIKTHPMPPLLCKTGLFLCQPEVLLSA